MRLFGYVVWIVSQIRSNNNALSLKLLLGTSKD